MNGDHAMPSKLKHVNRRLSDKERARHSGIRAAAEKDIPPKSNSDKQPSPPGIPSKVRHAREARGMSWYALAKAAGIPNSSIIRDLELGKDVKLSYLHSVATALGLQLDLVEQVA